MKQRAEVYKNKVCTHIIKKGKVYNVSYDSLWKRVIEVGKRVIFLFNNQGKKPTVGLLTHNQLNGALVDLACLSFGYKVVPIPLNSTPEHVSYIINHSEISHLLLAAIQESEFEMKIKDLHNVIDINLSEVNKPSNYSMNWNSISSGDIVKILVSMNCLKK